MDGTVLRNRYAIAERLADGMSATTYAGTDQATGRPIIIKHLALKGMRDWKLLELFEREGRVLAELSHPAIPRYIAAFADGDESQPSFYLVQERVPGESLAEQLAGNWRASEHELHGIAEQALQVLAYIHDRTPPIIHRDIKPANLIRAPNGKLFVVDFGAVTDIQRDALGTSHTLVGTVGYMAPEQLTGHVAAASDLYSLGQTLVHCATGVPPRDLPSKRGVVLFRGRASVSFAFARFLDRLIAPDVEDRFPSASAALTALRETVKVHHPRRTRIPIGIAAATVAIVGGYLLGRSGDTPEVSPPPTPAEPTVVHAATTVQITDRLSNPQASELGGYSVYSYVDRLKVTPHRAATTRWTSRLRSSDRRGRGPRSRQLASRSRLCRSDPRNVAIAAAGGRRPRDPRLHQRKPERGIEVRAGRRCPWRRRRSRARRGWLRVARTHPQQLGDRDRRSGPRWLRLRLRRDRRRGSPAAQRLPENVDGDRR